VGEIPSIARLTKMNPLKRRFLRKTSLPAVAIGVLTPIVFSLGVNLVTGAEFTLSQRVAAGLLLAGTSLFAIVQATRSERAAWKQTRTNWLYADVTDILSKMTAQAGDFHKSDNYFKLMLAHFRVQTEGNKFKKISEAHDSYWSLRALNMWDYFIYVFRAIFRELSTSDEYLTVSVIDFWAKDKPSTEISHEQVDIGPFDSQNLFETNYFKCVSQNVRSKRVILVNKDRAKRGKLHPMSEDGEYYEDYLKTLRTFTSVDTNERFQNYFYVAEESEYKDLLREDVPFALVERGSMASKLCISTYIPGLHKDEARKTSWRSGCIPKVGFYICSDATDDNWKRMYGKFDRLFHAPTHKRFKPEELFRLESAYTAGDIESIR
jgi:hypothetical protein